MERTANLSGPYVVLAAFAVELYLKTLSVLHRGEFLVTHDLSELFENLDRTTKDKLRKHHERIVFEYSGFPTLARLGVSTSLDFFVNLNRNAFENYRYTHEGNAKSAFFLVPFTRCLRERIVRLHPEYKTA